MKAEKKVVYGMEKCYSIAPLFYRGKQHMLVAAEKTDDCIMMDMEGNYEETVWKGPSGTMSMVQVPDTDGWFLATREFYSPNDSKQARIVLCRPDSEGNWVTSVVKYLPHVHRFGILGSGKKHYLIAATLCSGRDYKDDWSYPGMVYACELPEDLTVYSEDNQLEMKVLKQGLLKNHGYYQGSVNGVTCAVIGAGQGIFQFVPPCEGQEDWEISQLSDLPASDMTFADLDGDGFDEMITIEPFHGDTISIYRKLGEVYIKVYTYGEKAEFAHAIWAGIICGRPAAVIGHRKGSRKLIMFSYRKDLYENPTGDSQLRAGNQSCAAKKLECAAARSEFEAEVLDTDAGAANVWCYEYRGSTYILAANRESDEIALYKMEEGDGQLL